MAYRIPVYPRSVDEGPTPNYRVRAESPNLQPLAQGLQQLAGGAAQAAQNVFDRVDSTRLQAAKTKAAELRIQFENQMDQTEGVQTLQRGAVAPKELREQLEKIGEDLPDRVKEKLRAHLDEEHLGFLRSVSRRVNKATDEIDAATYASGLQTKADKAALAARDGDLEEVSKALVDIDADVAKRAKDLGMNDEMKEQFKKQERFAGTKAAIDALIAKGDVASAKTLLKGATERLNSDDYKKLEDAVENAEEENLIESTATSALEASRKNTPGDGFHLPSALAAINSNDTLDAAQKKEARASVMQQYQQLDFALREQDAPNVALIESSMLRGRSPYKGGNKSLYNNLQPEQKAFIDAKWLANQRMRKDGSAADRRYQTEFDDTKRRRFQVLLLNEEAPNPFDDPTHPFFKGISDGGMSELELEFRKAQQLAPKDRLFVKSRVDEYARLRGIEGAAKRDLETRIVSAVISAAGDNQGKFEKGELRGIVEPMLLGGAVEEFDTWFRSRESAERKAREELGEGLDVFNYTPPTTATITDESRIRVDPEKFEGIRLSLAKKNGVSPSEVSDAAVKKVYEAAVAKGLIK